MTGSGGADKVHLTEMKEFAAEHWPFRMGPDPGSDKEFKKKGPKGGGPIKEVDLPRATVAATGSDQDPCRSRRWCRAGLGQIGRSILTIAHGPRQGLASVFPPKWGGHVITPTPPC